MAVNPMNYIGPPMPSGSFNGQQPHMGQMGQPQMGIGMGAQVPQGYNPNQGMQQQINPAGDPEFARTHHDYPHPGEIFMTRKEFLGKLAIFTLIGFIGGAFFMFKMFNRIVAVAEAL